MVQHISVRIPWKDNGYSGLVCDKPCYNHACLRLKNIATNRNDEREEELAGCPMQGHEAELPCVSEGGAFMSPVSHSIMTVHPYKASNPKTHGHFVETESVYPPFSLPAHPFAWMLRKNYDTDNIGYLASLYKIDFDMSREPTLFFDTNWVQDAANQRAIFDCFYRDAIPYKSLVIPYAKQVPFIEDSKRVVMGIGYVDNVTPPVEHKTDGTGKLRSITWETMVGHTIRDDRKNGFLFPYREMMAYADTHPDFDMRAVTVFAEDDYFEEFSYATEHVSHDAVISVLLQSLKAFGIIKQCIEGNWDQCVEWINARLAEVWQERGAFPGAGVMLWAMNFQFGILIAQEVKTSLTDGENYTERFEKAIAAPMEYLSDETAASISGTPEQKAFLALSGERNALFWLLSRFSLSLDQALVLFNRGYETIDYKGNLYYESVDIGSSDAEIIKNPYIIYEKTRMMEPYLQVAVRKIDMALLPRAEIRRQYPIPAPSALVTDNDERRIRAIAISILEAQAENGHTVYPQSNLIAGISDLPIEPPCNVTGDILSSIKTFLSQDFTVMNMKNGGVAYQLVRFKEIDEVIRKSVDKRVNSPKRHNISENWRGIVDQAFKDKVLTDPKEEERARQEKSAILKELAEARLSVLAGGAGTGKTTLLALLCSSEQIQNGGVLLLAPTGKARVRVSQAMQEQGVRFKAKTVAQFLIQNKRFDYATMRYLLSNTPAKDVPQTVIIDECSMLTEEMFGALVQALKDAQRIIFAGDPNQLPPIGAGRPFVDLVYHLKRDIPAFPRVGKSYGELTVTRRHMDTALAEWYTDTDAELDDQIFALLQGNKCGAEISFKTWETPEELEQLLLQTVADEIGMNDVDDIDGFNRSLGSQKDKKSTYFNAGKTKAEEWQILAPVRNQPQGVLNINYLIHSKYRAFFTELAKRHASKLIPAPMGAERIVYGDKVINVVNKYRDGYFWDERELDKGFVANGEVGVAVAGFSGMLQVEFSTQPRVSYQYQFGGDEGEIPLELAYALTVHKAQGSEFGKVILVIGEPCRLLSKELLYTAITRQKERLVILYNDEAYKLRNYSSKAFSDIASRFTCLFEAPDIIEYKKRYYEARLIHKTARGELVRSKSEVIIADALYDKGIDYNYEKELSLGEDGIRIPDFTIDDAESGTLIYWEHCGMMNDEGYRLRWTAKRAVYEKHGIVEGKNLIVTYDNADGGIDSQAIRKLIERYLL